MFTGVQVLAGDHARPSSRPARSRSAANDSPPSVEASTAGRLVLVTQHRPVPWPALFGRLPSAPRSIRRQQREQKRFRHLTPAANRAREAVSFDEFAASSTRRTIPPTSTEVSALGTPGPSLSQVPRTGRRNPIPSRSPTRCGRTGHRSQGLVRLEGSLGQTRSSLAHCRGIPRMTFTRPRGASLQRLTNFSRRLRYGRLRMTGQLRRYP